MDETLEELRKSLSEALQGLGLDQTQLRPAADISRWSIQQIAQHLTLTYIATASVFEARLEKGTATRASPSIQQRAGQFLITTLGRFPAGRKSPGAVDPGATRETETSDRLSGDALARAAVDQIMRFDLLADRAEQLFAKRRAISHIVLGPLSVRQWRRFHLVHGRHHIRQIAAIRKEHGI